MLLGLEDHGVCWVLWDFHPVCAIACIPGSDDVDIPLPPPSPPPPPPHPSPPLPPPASGLYYLLLLQLKLAPSLPIAPVFPLTLLFCQLKGERLEQERRRDQAERILEVGGTQLAGTAGNYIEVENHG